MSVSGHRQGGLACHPFREIPGLGLGCYKCDTGV